MEQKTSNQEADLMHLLAMLIRTLKANKFLTIVFPIIGMLGGYIASSLTTSTVQASMMVSTDLISEAESTFLFDQLGKADSIQGLTKEQEKQVFRINYEVLKGEQDINKSTPIYFKITTVISDKKVLPVLQNAIVNYLNNSAPVKRHREKKEKLCMDMIHKIDGELAALQQVEKEVNDKTKATFLDPSGLFEKSVELNEKKVQYELAYKDAQTIHIVKGFGSLTKLAKLPSALYVIVGFFVGVIALMLVIFLKSFGKYYNNFERNSN